MRVWGAGFLGDIEIKITHHLKENSILCRYIKSTHVIHKQFCSLHIKRSRQTENIALELALDNAGVELPNNTYDLIINKNN
jgi:hypothetical protein